MQRIAASLRNSHFPTVTPLGRCGSAIASTFSPITKASAIIYSCMLDGSEVTPSYERSRILRALSVDRWLAHRLFERRRNKRRRSGERRQQRRSRSKPRRPSRKPCAASKTASESLEHFAPHPDGTRSRSSRAAKPSRCRCSRVPCVNHGASEHSAHAFDGMAHGRQALRLRDRCEPVPNRSRLQRADASDEPKIVTSGDIGRVTELAVSPASDVIAFANHRHELCTIDLDEGKVRVLDTSPADRIQDLAFSPDGRYIAYVWSPTRGASIIRVVKVRSGKVHDVTSPVRVDHSPAWDPRGKVSLLHLDAGLSTRCTMRCSSI